MSATWAYCYTVACACYGKQFRPCCAGGGANVRKSNKQKGTMLEQGLFKSQQASSLTARSAVCFVPPPPPQKGELSVRYNICCCRQRIEQDRNDSHLFKTDHAMLI